MNEWYAIFVETGWENEVVQSIRRLMGYKDKEIDYHIMVPKRKLKERCQGITNEVVRVLFPGYIFLSTDEIDQMYQWTKNCKHMIRYLRNENEFQRIYPEEICQIQYLMGDDGIIEMSDVIVENTQARIIRGPLINYKGFIRRIDRRRGRAKIELSINGNMRLLDVGINVLERWDKIADGMNSEESATIKFVR